MEAKAVAKFIRVSPRKTRLVAKNVKGMGIEDAMNVLRFSPQKAAKVLGKVLHSAVANAEQLPGMDIDSLYV
jgi:large subunit ribosomal protein L22